jgi:hypothetical protein
MQLTAATPGIKGLAFRAEARRGELVALHEDLASDAACQAIRQRQESFHPAEEPEAIGGLHLRAAEPEEDVDLPRGGAARPTIGR